MSIFHGRISAKLRKNGGVRMKKVNLVISGAVAIILLCVNILYNGYLLTLVYAFGASLSHFVGISHSGPHSDLYWGCFGFGSVALVILVGVLLPRSWAGYIFVGARNPQPQENALIKPQLDSLLEDLDQASSAMTRQQKTKCRKVVVLMSDQPVIEAQAFGGSIIITSLALNASSPEELSALLAHALYYIYTKVGMVLAVITYMNLPLRLIMWLYKFYVRLSLAISKVFSREGNLFSLLLIIPLVLFSPIALLNYIGQWLVKGSLACIVWLYK